MSLKNSQILQKLPCFFFCPSAQDNSSSGVNNSSLGTQKRGFLRPWCLLCRLSVYLSFVITQRHQHNLVVIPCSVTPCSQSSAFTCRSITMASCHFLGIIKCLPSISYLTRHDRSSRHRLHSNIIVNCLLRHSGRT